MCLVYLFPILFYLFLLLIYLFIHSVINCSALIIVLLWGNQFLETPLGCRWQGNRSSRMWEISEVEDLARLCPCVQEGLSNLPPMFPHIPDSFLPTSPLCFLLCISRLLHSLCQLFLRFLFPPYFLGRSLPPTNIWWQCSGIWGHSVMPWDWVYRFDDPFLKTLGYNSPWHLDQRPRRFKNVAKGI